MALKVTHDERDGWTVLTVSGALDLVTAPTVRGHVHEAVADGRRDLVLDLAGVDFCDSSGVGVLISARRLMRSCAGRLRLILPSDVRGTNAAHVNKVLAALGVRRLFEVFPDIAAATDDEAGPLSA
ncbi:MULTISPECIES: STAS domain-containing protein [unclassified Streptomyces]|uniref:STAS domain-containing protein n=1 Tax=unclassified Streptomyces TaxID=2593676 RepID=UPI0037FD3C93